jgi:hypothetical protein
METGPVVPDQVRGPAATSESDRHNPYIVGLLAAGGFAWLIALMLWIVHGQVTDYVTYDRDTAAALTAWMMLLLLVGTVAFVGSALIAGVGYELRRPQHK